MLYCVICRLNFDLTNFVLTIIMESVLENQRESDSENARNDDIWLDSAEHMERLKDLCDKISLKCKKFHQYPPSEQQLISMEERCNLTYEIMNETFKLFRPHLQNARIIVHLEKALNNVEQRSKSSAQANTESTNNENLNSFSFKMQKIKTHIENRNESVSAAMASGEKFIKLAEKLSKNDNHILDDISTMACQNMIYPHTVRSATIAGDDLIIELKNGTKINDNTLDRQTKIACCYYYMGGHPDASELSSELRALFDERFRSLGSEEKI